MLINAFFKLIFNTNKESKLSKNKIFSNTSAQRYSLALYELAIESNLLNKIEEQTSAILNLINSSKDFSNLIKNPTGNQDDLISVINKISENYNIENLLKNFITFLIKKRRFFYIKKILRNFTEICSKKRGELKAELKSAKELSSDEIKKITDELEKNFNSKMKLNYIHDKSLIGGLIVQIGSTMVDTSIKNKLQQIENRMIGV
jgi:F-type H+-transporting ATPase subunit delta